ncbi:MAG: hypothetical protein H7838_06430 [Magnetococcus sp. DMHC-8]
MLHSSSVGMGGKADVSLFPVDGTEEAAMIMKCEDRSDGLWRWQAIKQSLLLVTAIFVSTIVVVAFSTVMQKAAHFVTYSVRW